jgi:hypothetical protein
MQNAVVSTYILRLPENVLDCPWNQAPVSVFFSAASDGECFS